MKLAYRLSCYALFVFCCLSPSPLSAQASAAAPPAASDLAQLSSSLQALAERVGPCVVQVFTSGFDPIVRSEGEITGVVTRQRGTGSGVIVDPEGYIITNAHVVQGARQVQVLLAVPPNASTQLRSILKPRGEIVPARIVGTDPETDLAVLKIEKTGLPSLQIGDSDALRQGQLVLAFGSPLGLTNSVSMGVVSSVARQLEPESPMIYIQTDATINPGNSGGPLVNMAGHVMGINTSIFSQSGGSEGIGFAVPSNIVSNVYSQIRKSGWVRRGEIGVVAQTITPVLASGLQLAQDWGVILADVIPGGTAAIAGLQPNDIILTVNGKVMENARQFEVNLYQYSIGQVVTLEILRGTQKITKGVGLNDRPEEPSRFADLVNQGAELISDLGVFAIGVNDLVRRMIPLREASGVLVAAVSVDAANHGIVFEPGDVIHSINGNRIPNLAGLKSTTANLKSGDAVVIHAERRGRYLLLAFTKE